MIARRFSFPRIRSPDCGYSSTMSSESSRSWASTSFASMARWNCSTIVRLSAIVVSSPWRGLHRPRSPAAYLLMKARCRRLRADVLVQPEDVVGIVFSLERAQPVVLHVAVDRAHDVVALFDDIVHVLARTGERFDRTHRGATPGDVFAVLVLIDPECLSTKPVRGAAARERHRVLVEAPRRASLSPDADGSTHRALSRPAWPFRPPRRPTARQGMRLSCRSA